MVAFAAMLDYCSNVVPKSPQSIYDHQHPYSNIRNHTNPVSHAISSFLSMNMNFNVNTAAMPSTEVVTSADSMSQMINQENGRSARRRNILQPTSFKGSLAATSSELSRTNDVTNGNALVLSSQPLVALHNLTEMKFPTSSAFLSPQDYQQTMRQMQFAINSGATPHGISDILSRPHGLLPALGTASGMYLASGQFQFPKLAELPGRQPIYWPGVMSQPWRPPPGISHQVVYFCLLTSNHYISLMLNRRGCFNTDIFPNSRTTHQLGNTFKWLIQTHKYIKLNAYGFYISTLIKASELK